MRYFPLLLVVLLIIGCQTKPVIEPVDLAAVENVLNSQLDNLHTVMKAKDIEGYKAFLTDDGFFCGTDPEEIWGKEEVVKLIAETFANDSIVYNYSIDRREILVDADGKSATSLEQFFVNWMSPTISLRFTSHFVKTGETWKIDFFSWSFVPKNEDMLKINLALE